MKRILVCLGDSSRARVLARFLLDAASTLAVQVGAGLCLLRVVDLPAGTERAKNRVELAREVLERMTSAERLHLEAHAGKRPLVAIEGIYVRVGTPWEAICREAKRLDCDLVVMGTHGYSSVDRIVGTTAAKVVNYCDRSVLVLRPLPGRRSSTAFSGSSDEPPHGRSSRGRSASARAILSRDFRKSSKL